MSKANKRSNRRPFHQANRPLDAATVKGAISPIEFYRSQLDMPPPKQDHGWVPGGHCPFHTDKSNPNFRVHLDSGAFYCFACGEHGDVIRFVMLRHKLSFKQAMEVLSRLQGAIQ